MYNLQPGCNDRETRVNLKAWTGKYLTCLGVLRTDASVAVKAGWAPAADVAHVRRPAVDALNPGEAGPAGTRSWRVDGRRRTRSWEKQTGQRSTWAGSSSQVSKYDWVHFLTFTVSVFIQSDVLWSFSVMFIHLIPSLHDNFLSLSRNQSCHGNETSSFLEPFEKWSRKLVSPKLR